MLFFWQKDAPTQQVIHFSGVLVSLAQIAEPIQGNEHKPEAKDRRENGSSQKIAQLESEILKLRQKIADREK